MKSAPPTIPMRPVARAPRGQGSCLGRLGAFAVGGALALALLGLGAAALYWWWLPSYVDQEVRAKLARAEARLGAPVRCEEVRLEGLRTVTLRNLTVGHRSPRAEPMVEIPTVEVTIDLSEALLGEVRPGEVTLERPVVRIWRGAQGQGDLDPLLEALDERLAQEERAPEGEPGQARWIPTVQINQGTVLVQDEWTPGGDEAPALGRAGRLARLARSPVSALREVSLRLEAPDGRLGAGAALRGSALVSGGDERWLKAPSRVNLEVSRSRDEGPWRAEVKAQPAVQIPRVPGMEGLRAEIGGASASSDGAVELTGLSVGLRGAQEPLLEAKALRVTLAGAKPAGVWLEEPRVSVSTGAGGAVETLRELWRPSAGEAAVGRAEALAARLAARKRKGPSPSPPVAAAADGAPRWAAMLGRLPAEVHVQGGALRWRHLGPQPESLELEAIQLDLDHQLLRGRVEGKLQVRHGEGGEGALEGEIFYQDGRLQIKGEQPPLRAAALARRLHPKLKMLRGGSVGGRLAVSRAGWGAPWEADGELKVKGLEVFHERIAEEALEDIDLTLAGKLRWDPARGDLRVQEGLITLEEAASLRLELDLEGIGHGDPRAPLDLRRIKVRAFSAPTDAQALYEAIPRALRVELEGTRLKGKVGLRFEATIDPLRIADMEVDSDVSLKGFDIVAYNPDRDARALLGEFRHHVVQPETGYEFEISPSSPEWTSLQSVSPYMVKAIRTNEDGSFYSHGGISWLQVRSTLERNIQERRFARGASTVSMQVVKNVFLSHRKTLARKLQEVFLTLAMEQVVKVPKDRIMEIYLNIVEWGPNVYGIRRAARHYFGKSPSALTPGEAVWLVSILPGPRRYHSYYSRGGISDVWWDRMRKLLKVMLERGHLTPEEFAQADAARPLFSYSGQPVNFVTNTPEPAPPEEKVADPEEPAPRRFDKDANPIP